MVRPARHVTQGRLSVVCPSDLLVCRTIGQTGEKSMLKQLVGALVLSTMESAVSLLDSVYGSVDGSDFPRPLKAVEAGLCHSNQQRRYLWTDSFAVLAYVSLAKGYQLQGNEAFAQKYHGAADRLINVVHDSLGKPADNEHKMRINSESPSGYVGLRIGKVLSQRVTDYGMHYDGQYWHYIDKWLFALARADRVKDAILIAKSSFPYFYDSTGGGIRWKLSVDATAPPELKHSCPNDDTVAALIVFSLLETHRTSDMPSLREEIRVLKTSLRDYAVRPTADPLGWGMDALYDQFLKNKPYRKGLALYHSRALHPAHISLPFRLYGAMIGGRLAGPETVLPEKIEALVDLALEHERKAQAQGDEEHSSINRVMLAMCLLSPGALGRQSNDPLIDLGERAYVY